MLPAWALAPIIFLAAALYASVGHGGASAYLAIFILAGYSVAAVAPVVLVMNIGVASTSFASYRAAGHFRPRLLWPFLVTSIPAAFLGGYLRFPATVQEAILGVAFVLAALRFLIAPTSARIEGGVDGARPPPLLVALLVGGVLGFLAGATGIGGGVYLTPLLLLARWAEAKPAAAASAAFIVLNSASGLAGHLLEGAQIRVDLLLPLLLGALLGGVAGSWVGARKLTSVALQRALGVVLLLAAVRSFV